MTAFLENACDTMLDRIGRWMARRLDAPTPGYQPYALSDYDTLCQTLRIGDVVLVEGRQNVSVAIKYLTQSTWSHAALYVGNMASLSADGELPRLVEVELAEGCVAVPLSKYRDHNIRICRPRGLPRADRLAVARFMVERIGMRYDFRNILDLARYFLPTPPVPVRWRRRMLALGSGDPTRAICSSLIAQAFQSVRYPILPDILITPGGVGREAQREIFHIRHHSLFAPRDFDLSPFFEIVKPRLVAHFNPREIPWGDPAPKMPPFPGLEIAACD
ncbi:YiiX/YebB-like N1pC/P60 family cysteine hydrolase [Aurantimonas sp. A2-1-M11]|uniref:YiiX/YebB-like N1pC/P60 family cysteine hydrolase n=1 Tax=Aurantimonas sp. A2-1-M11 TaxID=3113712 RepID=UPI002F93BEB7